MGTVQLLLGLNFDFNRLIPADHNSLTNVNIGGNHGNIFTNNNTKTSFTHILPSPGNNNTPTINAVIAVAKSQNLNAGPVLPRPNNNAVTKNNSQDLNLTRMTKTMTTLKPMYQPPPVIFPFPSPYLATTTFVAPPWPINNVPTNSGFD